MTSAYTPMACATCSSSTNSSRVWAWRMDPGPKSTHGMPALLNTPLSAPHGAAENVARPSAFSQAAATADAIGPFGSSSSGGYCSISSSEYSNPAELHFQVLEFPNQVRRRPLRRLVGEQAAVHLDLALRGDDVHLRAAADRADADGRRAEARVAFLRQRAGQRTGDPLDQARHRRDGVHAALGRGTVRRHAVSLNPPAHDALVRVHDLQAQSARRPAPRPRGGLPPSGFSLPRRRAPRCRLRRNKRPQEARRPRPAPRASRAASPPSAPCRRTRRDRTSCRRRCAARTAGWTYRRPRPCRCAPRASATGCGFFPLNRAMKLKRPGSTSRTETSAPQPPSRSDRSRAMRSSPKGGPENGRLLGFTLGQAISRESSSVTPRKLRASLIFGYYIAFRSRVNLA